jgi:hypothetical protein
MRGAFPAPELIATVDRSADRDTKRYSVGAVKWPVFAGVWAEGLLEPKAAAVAAVIALPDADQTRGGRRAGVGRGEGSIRRTARRCRLPGADTDAD